MSFNNEIQFCILQDAAGQESHWYLQEKLLKLLLLILFCENTILLPLFCITSNSPTAQAGLICDFSDIKQGLVILWQQHCNAKHNNADCPSTSHTMC